MLCRVRKNLPYREEIKDKLQLRILPMIQYQKKLFVLESLCMVADEDKIVCGLGENIFIKPRLLINIFMNSAQLLSNYIDVTSSLNTSLTHGTFSCWGHISVICGTIWKFFKVLLPKILWEIHFWWFHCT